MAQILIQRDPSSINDIERYEIGGQINLLDWLIKNESQNFSGLHAQIAINGEVVVQTWVGEPKHHNENLDIDLGIFDTVCIQIRPKGTEVVVAIVVGLVAAAVSIALAPKPNIPSSLDSGTGALSSNNQLNSASNDYRPREAIPDIGGQVVAYPDFVQLSYYEYEANARVFREIFCLGVGQYQLDGPFMIGGDLLLDSVGSSVTTYHNSTPPNLLNVRVNRNSQEVDLEPAGSQTSVITLNGSTNLRVADFEIILNEQLVATLNPVIGDEINLNFQYSPTDDDPNIYDVDELATVTFVDETRIFTSYQFPIEGFKLNGFISKTSSSTGPTWYTLEGDEITEVWLDLKAPSGLKSETGGFAEVNSTMTLEQLDANGDPTGVTFEQECRLAGNTRSPLYQTYKFTQDDGIGIGAFRFRVQRTTASLGDNAVDLITMEAVKSVTPYSANWQDLTIFDVTRTSDARVARGQSDKFNVLATRMLRIYDPDTGVYGASYVATRRFCDYVFYLLHEVSGVAISDIDSSLYESIDNITDDQLGYFDGTFDDRNMSLRDRMEIICSNCRVRYWNVGTKWLFTREEVKPLSSMMFNRRNLKRNQNFTQSFRTPSDFDGVTIRYVDPETNSESQIYRSILSDGTISNEEGLNSLEFNMTLGCRSELQATNRAELEVRRLIYQGIRVTDTALMDALEMQIGERVDYVDIFDGDVFDGEIMSISGDSYMTSERFEPVSGVEYYVYITDDSGAVSNSVICTARADGDIYGFEATGLAGAYLAGGVIQSGSRYVIASAEDLDASSFVAISRGRPNGVGECDIELAEYNPLMFEMD